MKTEVKSESSRVSALISGVLVGYAITCIVFLAYSMLITFTSLSDDKTSLVVAAATLISVIVAGFDAARGASTRGWFWGIMAGLVYAFILLVLMALVMKSVAVDSRTLTIVILSVAGGGLGGVVGINFKK